MQGLIDAHAQGSWLGVFGEPRVNVLELNLALDRRSQLATRGRADETSRRRRQSRRADVAFRAMSETRPDPDQLLAHVKAEAKRVRSAAA